LVFDGVDGDAELLSHLLILHPVAFA
jgi:hypothetical protein